MNNRLSFDRSPARIISIVPSQSELLWDLGLGPQLVGITKFCIHPDEMFISVERVGGTKNLDLDKIRALQPDIIIGNKEENEEKQVKILSQEFNVWMSDIYNFEDSLKMTESMGTLFGKETITDDIIKRTRASLQRIAGIFPPKRVAYFIWNKPYLLAARNTFIDHVLHHLGLVNAASHLNRYPELGELALKSLNPELCFLSSEPFPFKAQHKDELQELLPGAGIMFVDGEAFSWYGSRLLQLEKYAISLKEELEAS